MKEILYFGYGSNMLAKRLHLQNPSAERVCPGRLNDYRLDFFTISPNWRGAPATIVPDTGKYVLGAIWKIDVNQLMNLDKQEGVKEGIYLPLSLPVESLYSGELWTCRTYRLVNQPKDDLTYTNWQDIPYNRQPSETYLKTLIKGAIETGIPQDYVEQLRAFKHNGRIVDEFEKKLQLDDVKIRAEE